MKRKCDEVICDYLSLDYNARVPLNLSLHLLFCSECRKKIKDLTHACKVASMPLELKTPLDDESVSKIMEKILPLQKKSLKKTLGIWIVLGLVFILSLLVLLFLAGSSGSRSLSLYFSSFFASSVSVLCMVFVASNMELFIKMIKVSE